MNNTNSWKRDGHLVCSDLFDASLISELREGCDASLAQWQRESTKEGEPGEYCYGPQAWIMLHLNHPKYHRQHPERLATLLNAVAHPRVVAILDELFGEPAVPVQINYYIDPSETRPARWHRDCQFYAQFTGVDESVLLEREADPPRDMHMHIPLIATTATEMVPGSQLRVDTAEENRIRNEDSTSDDMPDALKLRLEPGDLGFFHVNSLHRGSYEQGVPRRTIAVTFTRARDARIPTLETMKERRGYDSSYQPWFLNPGYLDGCLPAARAVYQRFIDVHRDCWHPELLGSLHPSLKTYFTEYTETSQTHD